MVSRLPWGTSSLDFVLSGHTSAWDCWGGLASLLRNTAPHLVPGSSLGCVSGKRDVQGKARLDQRFPQDLRYPQMPHDRPQSPSVETAFPRLRLASGGLALGSTQLFSSSLFLVRFALDGFIVFYF